jgi:carbamoyltransferase
VIGWFQGPMEFGPRALGSRSIIGDARSPKMQSVMNLKIKFRESFRPFAPIVLREHASEYFDIAPQHDSPYMLIVAPVRDEKRKPVEPRACSASTS